ncbi:hypothetical protein H4R99_007289 [Coemansia sp. RSA 1722]|nr:hypothetical protein LPJ57_003928 [Coemansia sp. RSA 486]KAJ2224836.1 hypothetical protein IWW45_008004 [Coemansia sp. RSA 485]KAJ2589924.1 hypothetical protein H4R99_007289 [Coemansia sp. RSA 1722]
MEASRSTIIKSILVREGPKTINQLFLAAHKSFPEQFKGVSRHKFKRVYLKNLKEFKHVEIKPVRDPEALEKLRQDPDSRVTIAKKEAWLVRISERLIAKYESGQVNLDTSHKDILKKIEQERSKSKDFWAGNTNKPHDWRAVLEASGHKVGL